MNMFKDKNKSGMDNCHTHSARTRWL